MKWKHYYSGFKEFGFRVYWGNIGIMKNYMETAIQGLGI